MKQAKAILRKLLYPPKEVLYFLPPVVFIALIFIFAVGKTRELADVLDLQYVGLLSCYFSCCVIAML